MRPRRRGDELAGTIGGFTTVNVDAVVDVDAGAGAEAEADAEAEEGDMDVDEGTEETDDDALEASERLRSARSPAPGCVA